MSVALRSFTRRRWVATTNRIVPQSLRNLRTFLLVGCLALALPATAQELVRALGDVPGFDFSRLPAPAKRELGSVLTDEFDYCGRPLTLLASLKKGDACKHTKRMVAYAANLASEGTSASEIIVQLSKYNQSFVSPKRNAFKLDDRVCVGPKDAKVTMLEFSDFECPYCAAARPIVEELAKNRPSVRLCYGPFPLSSHPHAILAGQAALFARDNGKFWALHDALFENQTSISEEMIKQQLTKLGLDAAQFSKAVAAGKYVDELKASKEAGIAAQVESTPTIFINGKKTALPLSAETLLFMVDEELEWVSANNSWPKD